MDWKSLTSKLDPLMTKLDPLFDKAKDAGYRALDFTQKQLQNTPIVLKTVGEYELLRTSKRFVLIAYDEADPITRDIILRSPVWSAQAWSDAAELRFVEVSSSPDIVRNLGITTSIDMRVWYIGNETFHATDLEEIKKWWKTRCYDGKSEMTDSWSQILEETQKREEIQKSENIKPEKSEIIDPLAGK
jgi:hypothetical protein